MYVPPHQCQKPKYCEGVRIEDKFSCMFNKVQGSDKVLIEMKEDVSNINKMLTTHSISIK